MNVLFIGAGAVNLSLIGWSDPSTITSFLLARGSATVAIASGGVKWRMGDGSAQGSAHPRVISHLRECPRPDAVVIGVKAYDLATVARQVADAFGTDMPMVALQNGVGHLPLLNSIFSRTVYVSVWYNSRKEGADTVVAMSRGPISLAPGTIGAEIFSVSLAQMLGVTLPVVRVNSANDMLRCKLVVNLSNSLVSLIGLHRAGTESPSALQQVLSAMLFEGITVLRAAGIQEVKVPGAPTWLLIALNRKLPTFITAPIFRKKLAKMSVSSMAQDLDAHPQHTELEEINGAFVRWAGELGVPVPVNKAVLALCRERFGHGFAPMSMAEVAAALR